MVISQLWSVVKTISWEFQKEDTPAPPMFLYEFYGVYVPRAAYATIWDKDELTRFFIMAPWNSHKIFEGLYTTSQRKLRYAMLKEFQKRGQETLRSLGYQCDIFIDGGLLFPESK